MSMTIAEKLVQDAENWHGVEETKGLLFNSISAKGVTVPAGAKLADTPALVDAIQTGGGTLTDGCVIEYIDSTGKILKTEMVAKGGNATPPTVARQYLTLYGWQGVSLQNIQKSVKFGAIYNTENDDTFIFLNISSAAQYLVFLEKTTADEMTFDLGDGTTFSTTATGVYNFNHYWEVGTYVLRISCAGRYYLGDGTSNGIFRLLSSSSANDRIEKIYCSSKVNIRSYTFSQSQNLREVVLSNGVEKPSSTSFDFYNCPCIKAIIHPNTITTNAIRINNLQNIKYFFISAVTLTIINGAESSLVYINTEKAIGLYFGINSTYARLEGAIDLQEGIIGIYSDGFNRATIEEINFPSTLQTLGNRAFYGAKVDKLDFPASLASIGSSALEFLYNTETLIFRRVTPPTLNSTITYGDVKVKPKIYVPDESVAAYKSETNWSTYANYIYPLSEYVE